MSRPIRLAAGCVGAVVLLTGACSSDDTTTTTDSRGGTLPVPTTSDTGDRSEPGEQTGSLPATTTVELVDTGADVDAPMDVHPLGASLLVAERAGLVKELVADGSGGYDVAGTVIDLREDVGSTDAEKGLLGITTDPSGEHLYLNHTRADDGATVVLELPLEGGPGALRASGKRELLQIDQPFANHNGGDLAWGPDEMLWVGTGDGGAGGDPDGRAQRLDTLLGKILRLDPTLDGDGSALAPDDNPHVDATGDRGDAGATAEPLIWARGVRNPWRISFDSATGDLWVADVGQDRIEEISVLRSSEGTGRGADLGWDRFEGDEEFEDAGPTSGWPDDDAPTIQPVHTYDHDGRCSISGGFVHRGPALPGLDGFYLFSDFCEGTLRAVSPDGDAVELGISGDAVVSINPDENGAPLVLDANGISRLTAA